MRKEQLQGFKDSYELKEDIDRTIRFWGFDSNDFISLINTRKEDKNIYWAYSFKDKIIIAYNYLENSLFRYDLKTKEEVLKFLENLNKKAKEKDLYNYIGEQIKKIKLLIDSEKPNKIKSLKKGETEISLNTFLYTSWGYDQTNVEIFKVIKIIGKNYFIIREVMQDFKEDGFMCSHEGTTETNKFLKEFPIKAFISNDGHMSICETGYKRSLWIHKEGERHYKSWYA